MDRFYDVHNAYLFVMQFLIFFIFYETSIYR